MATNPLSTMRFHRSLGIFVIIFTRFSLISQSILNRFLCNFAGTTCNYSGDCPEKFVKFERVFLKLLVRLVVNLLEYFIIYSFRRQFRQQFSTVLPRNFAGTMGWYYGDCPVNYVKFERILQKLLMQSTEPTLWQRRRSVFRWYLSQFSTVLHVILHTPFAAIAATALKILVRFDRVFQKLLRWCTETTLFPHR